MKKFIFTLIVFIYNNADAQIEKGNWMIGSNIAVSKLEINKTNTVVDIFLNPNAYLFLADKFALGAGLDMNFRYSKVDTSNSNFNWGVGPAMRYYFYNKNKGGAFVNLKLYFGGNKDANSSFNPELNIGYDFILNDFMALEFFTGYGIIIPFKGNDLSHKIPFGIGFQIFLSK